MDGLRDKIVEAIERAILEDLGRGAGPAVRGAQYILAIPELAVRLTILPGQRMVRNDMTPFENASEGPIIAVVKPGDAVRIEA